MKENNNNIAEIGKDILCFNKSLLPQYQKLAELEINGKIDSKEYKDTVELIKLIHEVSLRKIKQIRSNSQEINDYYNKFTYLNYLTDEEYVDDLIENFDKHIARRWTVQLYNYISINHIHTILFDDTNDIDEYDYEDFYDDYEDDDLDYIEQERKMSAKSREEAEASIEEEVRHCENVDLTRGNLINNVFMDGLLEEIKNQKDPYIKQKLIEFKYMFLFNFAGFDNHFTANPKKFTKTTLYRETLNCLISLGNDDIQELVIEPDFRMFEKEITYLSSLDEEFYEDKDNIVKTILKSNYLKTYLTINVSEESLEKMKEYIKELKVKSESSKQIIDKAYQLGRTPSILKKVDL